MKIDRQLGILSILLQAKSVTAPYLSEMFEVSRRTINRDIEDLCKAGIPIVTRQGINGGISIIDGYKIDKTMLTHGEMQDILAGLLYYAPRGESQRIIEPYYLIFRWSGWYVWGWCKSRDDYRLFKLNRMDKVYLSENYFSERTAPLLNLRDERIFPGGIKVKALFEEDCKWRLVEELRQSILQMKKKYDNATDS